VAELAGLKPTPGLAGRSLAPLLDDPTGPWKDAVYSQLTRGVRQGSVEGRSVRTDRYRYNEWDGGKRGLELYDHETDPHEFKNLAEDPAHKTTVAQLHELLQKSTNPANP
jgi:uncharacterized sulfatase